MITIRYISTILNPFHAMSSTSLSVFHKDGDMLLFLAFDRGHPEIFEKLIECGAKTNTRDKVFLGRLLRPKLRNHRDFFIPHTFSVSLMIHRMVGRR